MNNLEEMEALAKAAEILKDARIELSSVRAIWNVVDHAYTYIDSQIAELLAPKEPEPSTETALKTFRHIDWKGRDYECSNVVVCLAEKSPASYWQECDQTYFDSMLAQGASQLYIENGVRYFGWL